MSVYNGLPGNESMPSVLDVSTTTGNAVSPIVVTTTTAHGLVTGEYVEIDRIYGNDAANGRFYISVLTSTTFALYTGWSGGAVSGATTGTGAYVGTGPGQVRALSFAAGETLPEDLVDDADATSVNVPFEGNFDRETYLLRRTGAYRVTNRKQTYYGSQTDNRTTSWLARTAPNASWGDAYTILDPASDIVTLFPGDIIECGFFTGVTSRGAGYANELVSMRLKLSILDFDGSSAVVTKGASAWVLGGVAYGAASLFVVDSNNTSRAKMAKVEVEFCSDDGATATMDLTGIGIFHAITRAVNL